MIRAIAGFCRSFVRQTALTSTFAVLAASTIAFDASSQALKLRLVTAWPFEGAPGIKMEIPKMFIAEFNKRASGKAEIVVVGGPEVVSPFDQLKALQDGQFDMMVSTSLYFKEMRDLQFIHYMPYEQQVERVKTGYKLLQEISREKAGVIFVHLCCTGQSFFLWTRDKPIRTVADARGMKIRTFGDTTRPLQEALKIAPVNIPSNDVYSALGNKLLDGTLRESLSLDVLKEADHLKLGVSESVADINGETFISARAWDRLSPEIRKTMDETARWADDEGYKQMKKIVSENFAKIQKEKGVKMVPSEPDLVAAMAGIRKGIIDNVLATSKWKDQIRTEFKLQ